jgi:predicted alpha-1,2-mannosidase
MLKLDRWGTSFLVISLVLSAAVVYSFTATTRPFRAAHVASANLTQYVNPFVGTAGSGNTFPGVGLPFGEVQWSPDTTGLKQGTSYNYSNNTITGFSLTHLSGAGWWQTHATSSTCGIFGDVPFMPYKGTVTQSPAANPSAFRSSFSHSSETARPGYYSVQLSTPGVKAELTAATHTAFGQFSYPTSSTSTILISTGGTSQGASGTVAIAASTHAVTGSATAACSSNGSYTLYFAAQFSVPFTSYGTWNGSTLSTGTTSSSGRNSGAYVTFATTEGQPVEVTIGISFVSVANAQANMAAEGPGSFSTALSNADSAWNGKLNTIVFSGGSSSDLQTFYTALYHTLLFPSTFSDVNGQYMGFDKQVHSVPAGHIQYANFSGWDIYHSQVALLALLLPGQTSDMMQSLVNDYLQSGCLPKWSFANVDTDREDGDQADAILDEAYSFGATSFDTSTALQAMLKGATQTCTFGNYVERQGLSQYLSLGYIPYGPSGLRGTSSATLEYTSDDFAISQFAQALGDGSDATAFLKRAQNWKNLYDAATGLIEPKDASGNFVSNTSGSVGFHGGTATQYTWMIPYNLAGLFAQMGGNQTAVSRLDQFFSQLNAGQSTNYANLGNEPCLADPFEYDFAGQPWKTQATVRQAITQLYSATTGGIPGNDDLGTLSSWYVWSAVGLFPEYPGTGDLVLGSPLFSQSTINMSNGKQVLINAPGALDSTPYVQSLSLNGQSSTQLWQPFSTLANGATLQFTLGTSANTSMLLHLLARIKA